MENSRPGRGIVVQYANTTTNRPGGHESASRASVAGRLAALKDYDDGGEYDPGTRYGGPLYFVPADTLVSVETAHELGIRTEDDLFGGVVPYPFVATKAITHPLVDAQAQPPEGWSHEFGQRVQDSILIGYAAFTLDDARRAGERILKGGPARVKESRGIGGRGQFMVTRADELEAASEDVRAVVWVRNGEQYIVILDSQRPEGISIGDERNAHRRTFAKKVRATRGGTSPGMSMGASPTKSPTLFG